MVDINAVKNYLLGLQKSICQALTDIDGGTFEIDHWDRSRGGRWDFALSCRRYRL